MLSRNRQLLVLASIAVVFIFFRLYNLQNPFSTNGIDEGIHLLQAKMVSAGYNLYTDLNGDQGPLAILTYALFEGHVMASRLLSFCLFMVATAASALIAWRVKDKEAGVYVLLFLALDFTLLRESRLASLDLFSAALLSLGVLFMVLYMQKNAWWFLVPGATLVSMACLAKLMAVPFVLALAVWLLYGWLNKRQWLHLAVFLFGAILPVVVLLTLFAPQMLLEGMVLRQTQRVYEWASKLSVLLFIGPSFVYLVIVRRWDLRNRYVLLLLLWLLSLLAFIMLQGLTFQHHFTYVAFPAAVLAGIALTFWQERNRRLVLVAFVAVNAVLGPVLIMTAPPDMTIEAAEHIQALTPADAMVIAGNPLVNVLADRPAPLNLTNLAYYHYASASAANVTFWLKEGTVAAVVLYWKLSEMEDVWEYLETSGEFEYYGTLEGKGQILFEGLRPGFSTDRYSIYVNASVKPSP